jgi:LysM repeat protein
MAHSDSSFRMSASDKEGMIPQGIGLLFFAFLLLGPLAAEDYVVVKGDTATAVSAKKKVSAELLQRANPDEDWTKLKPGEHLFVPDKYTVKAGDTLYSLCRTWGVDQAAVLALNDLAGAAVLKSGQVLYIPAPKPVVKTAATVVPASFWPVDKTPKSEGDRLKSVSFATAGEAFRSVSSGTVVYQGEFRGVGRVLLVQRDDKTVFAYGNFENSSVEFGQAISRGQVLGTTSSRTSQRLAFFAFRQTESLDVFTAKR